MKYLLILFFVASVSTYSSDWKLLMKPANTNNYFALASVDSTTFLFTNDNKDVNIYQTKDNGDSWPIIYSIPSSSILNFNSTNVEVLDENNLFFAFEVTQFLSLNLRYMSIDYQQVYEHKTQNVPNSV